MTGLTDKRYSVTRSKGIILFPGVYNFTQIFNTNNFGVHIEQQRKKRACEDVNFTKKLE